MDPNVRLPMVFFDGICHLCNGFVDWVIRKDTLRVFHFAPLQGSTAVAFISQKNREDLQSVVVLTADRKPLQRSDAILFILANIPKYRFLAKILSLIPHFLRDAAYLFIARFRYQIFGKNEVCRLPTDSEKGYLLP